MVFYRHILQYLPQPKGGAVCDGFIERHNGKLRLCVCRNRKAVVLIFTKRYFCLKP